MSKRPYYDDAGRPKLEQSVIATADISGYCPRMREAFDNQKEGLLLQSLNDAITEARRYVDSTNENSDVAVKVFSDNLIVGHRFSERSPGYLEFLSVCWGSGHLQLELAVRGFFVSGGISVGPITITENLVFGPNLVELYKSDAEKGKKLCVRLLQSAIDYINVNPLILGDRSISRILMWDQQDRIIHYLRPLGALCNSLRLQMAISHKREIESQFAAARDPNVRQKFRWLADYHNRFCRSVDWLNNSQFFVSVDE